MVVISDMVVVNVCSVHVGGMGPVGVEIRLLYAISL
jgi:hypothetical protein